MEGVYIMHTRECLNANLPIYKIGRSHNLGKRIKQYPTGSNIICVMPCKTSIICEQLLIEIFKTKFIHKKNYGNEYFEGDYEVMVQTIIDTLFTYKNNILENFKILKEEKKIKQLEKNKEKQKNKETEKEKEKDKEQDKKIEAETKDIEQHIINDKTIIKQNLCCPKCNLFFTYPSKLKIHFEKSYHCKKNNDEIKDYFLVIKNLKSNKNHQCNNCYKCFSRQDSYARHKKLNKCKNI